MSVLITCSVVVVAGTSDLEAGASVVVAAGVSVMTVCAPIVLTPCFKDVLLSGVVKASMAGAAVVVVASTPVGTVLSVTVVPGGSVLVILCILVACTSVDACTSCGIFVVGGEPVVVLGVVGAFVVVVDGAVDTQEYLNQNTVASTVSGEHCASFIVLFIAPGYK